MGETRRIVPGYYALYGDKTVLATRSPQRIAVAQAYNVKLAPEPVFTAASTAEGVHSPVILDTGESPHVLRAAEAKMRGGIISLADMIRAGVPNTGLTVIDQGWGLGPYTLAQHGGDPSAAEEIIETLLETEGNRFLTSHVGIVHRSLRGVQTAYYGTLVVGRLDRIPRAVLSDIVRKRPFSSGGLTVEDLLERGLIKSNGFMNFHIARKKGPPLCGNEYERWGCIFEKSLPPEQILAIAVGMIPPDINRLAAKD